MKWRKKWKSLALHSLVFFLGVQSVRGDGGLGITVSYWKSLEDITDCEYECAD
jgi:hypothetical protein